MFEIYRPLILLCCFQSLDSQLVQLSEEGSSSRIANHKDILLCHPATLKANFYISSYNRHELSSSLRVQLHVLQVQKEMFSVAIFHQLL
jgi:hypothetical protein